MGRRFIQVMVLLLIFVGTAFGQEGTAVRDSLGDPIAGGSGEPRYREDSGWSDAGNFDNPEWGVSYDQQLSSDPFTVVLQADRTAALTASANKLTLDLDGHRYDVSIYPTDSGYFTDSVVKVYDQADNGSYLRVTNGTLGDGLFNYAEMEVGTAGHNGLFIVDHATVESKEIRVGAGANSHGEIILNEYGKVVGANSSQIVVGDEGDGTIRLDGPGSRLSAKSIDIGNPTFGGSGTIIVNDPDALVRAEVDDNGLQIRNAPPMDINQNIGLQLQAGRVEITSDVILGTSDRYGAVRIDGGTLDVGGHIDLASSGVGLGVTGGKLFLSGGELAVGHPGNINATLSDEFYWESGTVRFKTKGIAIRQSVLERLTAQGVASYAGDRRVGAIATGQSLVANGSMTLPDGVRLTGGTIRSGRVSTIGAISGHGTVDAIVDGSGTISSASGGVLEIGGLDGINPIDGAGEIRIGHLNQTTSYGGTGTGGGTIRKVGTGKQTVTGSLENTGGIFVDEGALAFDGASAGFSTTNLSVAAAGEVELLSGSSGLLTGSLTNAGRVTVAGGALTVNGEFVNDGWLINNGNLAANVSGAGKIAGSGAFSGAVDIRDGSTIAPGNSIGEMAVDDMTLGGGGEMEFEIGSAEGLAGSDWDLVSASGVVSLAAVAADPFLVTLVSLDHLGSPGILADFDPSRSYSWQLISANISDPGQWTPDRFIVDTTQFMTTDGPISSESFAIDGAADGVYLNYADAIEPAAVPEPSGGVLLLSLVPAWHLWRRRWRAVVVRNELAA